MFTIFESKKKKRIVKWKKEHNQIVDLATKVIAAYSKNNFDKAKSALKKLNDLAVDHVMDEDLEFYHWKKDANKKMHKYIDEFTHDFKNTKMELMTFLSKYSKEKEVLDETFFKSFNALVEVLTRRIEYEEKILYKEMEEEM